MTATLSPPAGIATGLPDVGGYVACLAAYNNGRLHGAWIDLEEATTADEIQVCIDWILATSPEPGAEEWAMHDSSGLPHCLSRTEWPDLSDLAAYGEAVAELPDDSDREAYRLWCDHCGEIVGVDDFREAYRGRHDCGEDFAYELADEQGLIPSGAAWPALCIDWELAWRELEGDYTSEPASSGCVHIFYTS